ncbi:unnamed protein product, partial [Ilex paraguariensis]
KDIDVVLQIYSRGHIDVVINERSEQGSWRFSKIYGELETSKRSDTWALLVHLGNRNDLSLWGFQ